MSKIMVKRNKHAAFVTAYFVEGLIDGPVQVLTCDRRYVMAVAFKNIPADISEILVQLKLHSAGTGMIRSRAMSAA